MAYLISKKPAYLFKAYDMNMANTNVLNCLICHYYGTKEYTKMFKVIKIAQGIDSASPLITGLLALLKNNPAETRILLTDNLITNFSKLTDEVEVTLANLVRSTTYKVLIGVLDDRTEKMSRLDDDKLKLLNNLERCVDDMCQNGIKARDDYKDQLTEVKSMIYEEEEAKFDDIV